MEVTIKNVAESVHSTVKSAQILVVDGDQSDRHQIRRMVGDRFDVVEAENGRVGLELYKATQPECVLLDHALSDLEGSSMFDDLIEQGATVIVMTNDGNLNLALDAVRRGAQDYLDKSSLNTAMLDRVIQYAIERDRLSRELHRSMAKLKESEQRFIELAAHIDHGLWIWTEKSEESIYQNPACDRIFGRTLQEMNSMHWFDIIHPDDRDAELERARHSKATKSDYESRIRIVHPNGDVLHLEQSCHPLLDENGEVVRIIGICRDVTERIKLEEELRLAHKLEAVGQLAAGVAHEINTPSQYVSDNVSFLADGFEELIPLLRSSMTISKQAKTSGICESDIEELAQLVENADLDYLLDEFPKALKQSQDGLEQIKNIVRAMKDFSHPGDEMCAVDINAALKSTVTVARNEWKYVADVQFDLDDDLPRVICVASAINQAILNLIVNAAHAVSDVVKDSGGEKGDIRISTRVSGDNAVIVIADTGCGMQKTVRDKIFDPFFTTKGVGKGTGQGLAIAYSVITERHNGRIEVASEPGKGAAFTIQLPIDGHRKAQDGLAA